MVIRIFLAVVAAIIIAFIAAQGSSPIYGILAAPLALVVILIILNIGKKNKPPKQDDPEKPRHFRGS